MTNTIQTRYAIGDVVFLYRALIREGERQVANGLRGLECEKEKG
jgi:hypothetical protein